MTPLHNKDQIKLPFDPFAKIQSTNRLSYTDDNLDQYKEYTYAVVAVGESGIKSERSEPLTLFTQGIPKAPGKTSGVELTSPRKPVNATLNTNTIESLATRNFSSTSVILSWGQSEDDKQVTTYKIYRNGRELTTLSSDNTTFVDTMVQENQEYRYTVTAIDKDEHESEKSNEAIVHTKKEEDRDDDKDKNKDKVDNITSNGGILNWEQGSWPLPGAGFTILNIVGGIANTIGSVGANVTSFALSGLRAGSIHQFIVIQKDKKGDPTGDSMVFEFETETEAPMNLQASTILGTSLTLSWEAPNDPTGIEGYAIYKNGQFITQVSKDQHTINIDQLTYGTAYTFTVKSVNREGKESQPSEPLAVKTLDLLPPTKLKAENIKGTSVDLCWQAPKEVEDITGYRIYQNKTFVKEVTPDQLYETITNLTYNTDYEFTLTSVIKTDENEYESKPSEPLKVKTLDLLPPTELKAENIKGTSVDLHWQAPKESEEITGYRIYQDGTVIKEAKSDQLSATISELMYNTDYEFTLTSVVKTEENEQESKPSESVKVKTLELLPPTKLKAKNIKGTSVNLSWQAPKEVEEITSYRIYQDGKPIKEVKSDQLSETMTELMYNTDYEFTLTSVVKTDKNEQESKPSKPIEVKTLDLLPPTELKAENIKGTSVDLSWQAPKESEEITGYRIYQDGTVIKEVKPDQLSETITGLIYNTIYEFKITSIVEIGDKEQESKPSKPVSVNTWHKIEPPTNLTASAMKGTSVQLNWQHPQDKEGITTYKIYKDGEEVKKISANSSSSTVDQLSPETAYQFSIASMTGEGEESENNPSITVSTKSVEPPSNLVVERQRINDVSLFWDAPKDVTNLEGYVIYKNGQFLKKSGFEGYEDIHGLESETYYEFSISAIYRTGDTTTESERISVQTFTQTDWDKKVLALHMNADQKETVFAETQEEGAVKLKTHTTTSPWEFRFDAVKGAYQIFYEGYALVWKPEGIDVVVRSQITENASYWLVEGSKDTSYYKIRNYQDRSKVLTRKGFISTSPELAVHDEVLDIRSSQRAHQYFDVTDKTDTLWPPTNLSTSNIGATKVTLNWDVPKYGAQPAKYNVYVNDELIQTVDNNPRSFMVENLDPETTYRFSVSAVYNQGGTMIESSGRTYSSATTQTVFLHGHTGMMQTQLNTKYAVAMESQTNGNVFLSSDQMAHNDMWRFHYDGQKGGYKIYAHTYTDDYVLSWNKATNKAVMTMDASTDEQLWDIVPSSNDYYSIRNHADSTKGLSVDGNEASNKRALIVKDYQSTASNQQFRLNEVFHPKSLDKQQKKLVLNHAMNPALNVTRAGETNIHLSFLRSEKWEFRYDDSQQAYQIHSLRDSNYIIAWNRAKGKKDKLFVHRNERKPEHYWFIDRMSNGTHVIRSKADPTKVITVTTGWFGELIPPYTYDVKVSTLSTTPFYYSKQIFNLHD